MYCLRCGAALSPEGPFCAQCGNQVPPWQWAQIQEANGTEPYAYDEPGFSGDVQFQQPEYENQPGYHSYSEAEPGYQQETWQQNPNYQEPWQQNTDYQQETWHQETHYYGPYPPYPYEARPKSRILALLFAIFLGYLGVHRFYTGKIGTGLLWLFTGGFFAFGWFIDIIMIATGGYRDRNNLPLY